MVLSQQLAPQLPPLRRYARALTGSQKSGDAYVAATIQAILDDRTLFDLGLPTRVALYKVFHSIWSTSTVEPAIPDQPMEAMAQTRLAQLPAMHRQALLLTTIESFTVEDVARIFGTEVADVHALVSQARDEIHAQTRARVLVIEDEALIALDLTDMLTRLGHNVVAVADTAGTAIEAAQRHRPDIVLADIQLADGSNGIDAVNSILSEIKLPVIFITAYPERLLTGEKPEPTWLIPKPFRRETVAAAVSQALFFHPAREVA